MSVMRVNGIAILPTHIASMDVIKASVRYANLSKAVELCFD